MPPQDNPMVSTGPTKEPMTMRRYIAFLICFSFVLVVMQHQLQLELRVATVNQERDSLDKKVHQLVDQVGVLQLEAKQHDDVWKKNMKILEEKLAQQEPSLDAAMLTTEAKDGKEQKVSTPQSSLEKEFHSATDKTKRSTPDDTSQTPDTSRPSKNLREVKPAPSSDPPTPPLVLKDGVKSDSKDNNVDDADFFDENLTIEDYELMEHSVPTKAWLTSCARTLNNNSNVEQPFKVLRPWYRLGDCIKLCSDCPQRKKQNDNFTSMASMYDHLACQGKKSSLENFTIVDQVFQAFETREGFQKPGPDVLVVHLRLGDVVERSYVPAEKLLTEGGTGSHPETQRNRIKSIHSLYTYLDIMDGINKNGTQQQQVNKIHLVGGSHKDFMYKVSKVYAHCLQRGLAKAGKKVEMWIEGRDPDQDFYYMSNAKRLITSTGGFSRMIGHMAKRRGGQLIGSEDLMKLKLIRKVEGDRLVWAHRQPNRRK